MTANVEFPLLISAEEILDFMNLKLKPDQIGKVKEFCVDKDLSYRKLSSEEKDSVILEVLKRIDLQFSKSGAHRHDSWSSGWQENLDDFVNSNYDLNMLVPKYYRPGNVKRFNGDYVITKSFNSELDFFSIVRFALFLKYFSPDCLVYEFGCGSPHNLVALSQQFPKIRAVGLDWTSAPIQMISLLSKFHNFNLVGINFDFFNPNFDIQIDPDGFFLSIGGLEQVGGNFHNFIDFVLKKLPKLVIQIEPISDLYKADKNLLDYLALKYHNSRQYLTGYFDYLKSLEVSGKLEIIHTSRIPFGGQFHEGWTVLIWRPIAPTKKY